MRFDIRSLFRLIKPAPGATVELLLPDDEAAQREFLRIHTESATESVLLRQALRNIVQFVDDLDHSRFLMIHRRNGEVIEMRPELFPDRPIASAPLLKRRLSIHPDSIVYIATIQDRLGLADASAVARFALRFFFQIVRDATQGARFFVSSADSFEERSKDLSREVRFGSVHSGETPISGQFTKFIPA